MEYRDLQNLLGRMNMTRIGQPRHIPLRRALFTLASLPSRDPIFNTKWQGRPNPWRLSTMERHTQNRHTVRFLVFRSLHSKTIGIECELLPRTPTRRTPLLAWMGFTRQGRGLG